MSLVLVTASATEPLTLAEAKAQARVTNTDEDTLITSLIVAARQHVETLVRRALVTQTWDYKLDHFPVWEIEIPLPPLASVSSVKYLESAAGVDTTLATTEYRVLGASGHNPGRITPDIGKVWPTTYDVGDAVTVRFVAGYGAAAAVPQPIKQAMLLLIAAWFENREAFVLASGKYDSLPAPAAVGALLRPYVVDYFG